MPEPPWTTFAPASVDRAIQVMRILVSTPTFLPVVGGAELGIHEIYKRLGREHDVTILTPRLPRQLLDEYGARDYTSDRYEVRRIFPELDRALPGTVSRILKRTSLLYAAELARIVRHERPDLINFHFIKPHGSALLLMRLLYGVPCVLSLVGRSDVVRLLNPPKRLYAQTVISQADLVLSNSTYYLRPDQSGPRFRVIPYGVDVDEFSPARRNTPLRQDLGLTDEHFLLFSVQRLAPVKRVDLLIRMMAEVVSRDPQVVLIIGGKGEEEAHLRQLVSDLDLRENVRFAGYIGSDLLPEYFASSDAFVFHSMMETFGIVFAQAMACGLPIVAADTSCIPDVLSSDNGFLVPPSDISAFADAVLTLAGNRELAKQIGDRNRARAVRELDWDLVTTRYEQALRNVLGHHESDITAA
jgi:glycosyltransferase involved in cell wall biosynthesis